MAPSPSLRETAFKINETNPSQLGDPISLKAETLNSSPTNHDRGTSSPSSSSSLKQGIKRVAPAPTEGYTRPATNGGDKTLRQIAMGKSELNPSQLGDPVSLKAETADSEPTEQDRGAAEKSRRSKL